MRRVRDPDILLPQDRAAGNPNAPRVSFATLQENTLMHTLSTVAARLDAGKLALGIAAGVGLFLSPALVDNTVSATLLLLF
jgi:hypothetical protein